MQAALEAEMAQLEVDKKLAEEKLAKVAAEMERMEQENQATLLETQLAMKKAEQELLDAQKQLDNATTQAEKDKIEAERQKLQERATAYSDAVDNLITAQNSLISMKTRLAVLVNRPAKGSTARRPCCSPAIRRAYSVLCVCDKRL